MPTPEKRENRRLTRLEQVELIKQLAHDQFIQQKLGKPTSFEQMWSEAFHISGPLVEPKPKQ